MELVEFQLAQRIGYITLNRPEKKNALNTALVAALLDTFEQAIDNDQVKVIVIRAKGDVFSAGADLGYLQQLQNNSAEDDYRDTAAIKDLFYTICTAPKIVIAQVEGHAIAGGCGLASVCDIIFSVPEAKFGYSEVKIGFIPAIVSCFLVRRLGEGRVRELLLSGSLIDAVTAAQYGLVNFIAGSAEIGERVHQYAAERVQTVSGNSIALTKQLLTDLQDVSLKSALEQAVSLNVSVRASEDCKKGIRAFLNKENLQW